VPEEISYSKGGVVMKREAMGSGKEGVLHGSEGCIDCRK